MSTLAVASAGTIPGVTTIALALTLAWARPVMLVEADVSKPSAVVAGLLQGALPADAGLMGDGEGVLIVGANDWTTALGGYLKKLGYPVTIADTSTYALRAARRAGVDIHRGEVLDEVTQDVVVTPERSIVVRTLRDGADLPSATRHLRGAGFVTEPGSARARFSACVGAPYCRRTDVSTLDLTRAAARIFEFFMCVVSFFLVMIRCPYF
mgnify:CR=1 FL=1